MSNDIIVSVIIQARTGSTRLPGKIFKVLSGKPVLEPIEFVRTIAVARIAMPASFVRLSAGRSQMPDYLQALCFIAGANSIFYGDRLLTTPNPESDTDLKLFEKLGIQPLVLSAASPGGKTAEA